MNLTSHSTFGTQSMTLTDRYLCLGEGLAMLERLAMFGCDRWVIRHLQPWHLQSNIWAINQSVNSGEKAMACHSGYSCPGKSMNGGAVMSYSPWGGQKWGHD